MAECCHRRHEGAVGDTARQVVANELDEQRVVAQVAQHFVVLLNAGLDRIQPHRQREVLEV
eukprot:11871899-Heterocapsa_arctica.AAC.1